MSTIYICPTPIGNLEDITLRVLRVLKEVDLIACEDTRTSKKLLDRYEIKKPLTSYHLHNYKEKIPYLIEKLNEGLCIAIISDAGMPGISDPGVEIIDSVIEAGHKLEVLPGPSASITALVASGLSNSRFTFVGFLSSKKSSRKKEMDDLKSHRETLIFYEAPHRIEEFLVDLKDAFGYRKIAICRELTKVFEEIIRTDTISAVEAFNLMEKRGEFVVIVEGSNEEEAKSDIVIEDELRKLVDSGMRKKAAVNYLVDKYNLNRNEVYSKSLEL